MRRIIPFFLNLIASFVLLKIYDHPRVSHCFVLQVKFQNTDAGFQGEVFDVCPSKMNSGSNCHDLSLNTTLKHGSLTNAVLKAPFPSVDEGTHEHPFIGKTCSENSVHETREASLALLSLAHKDRSLLKSDSGTEEMFIESAEANRLMGNFKRRINCESPTKSVTDYSSEVVVDERGEGRLKKLRRKQRQGFPEQRISMSTTAVIVRTAADSIVLNPSAVLDPGPGPTLQVPYPLDHSRDFVSSEHLPVPDRDLAAILDGIRDAEGEPSN